MRNAISIEWIKLKSHPIYFIIIGVTMLLFILIAAQLKNFTIGTLGGDDVNQTIGTLGLFNKGVILQTLSYVAGYFKYIIVIAFMLYAALDYRHKMHRKQTMEGWSRKASYFSKYIWIVAFIILQTLILYILGALLSNEGNKSWGDYAFFPIAWALEFAVLMSIGMFLMHLTKRAGISMIILLLYAIIAEPIITYRFSALKHVLPLAQSRALIEAPFQKYIDMFRGEAYVFAGFPTTAFLVSLVFTVLFALIGWWRFLKTDL
jgi:hypothetical protein